MFWKQDNTVLEEPEDGHLFISLVKKGRIKVIQWRSSLMHLALGKDNK